MTEPVIILAPANYASGAQRWPRSFRFLVRVRLLVRFRFRLLPLGRRLFATDKGGGRREGAPARVAATATGRVEKCLLRAIIKRQEGGGRAVSLATCAPVQAPLRARPAACGLPNGSALAAWPLGRPVGRLQERKPATFGRPVWLNHNHYGQHSAARASETSYKPASSLAGHPHLSAGRASARA